QRDVKFEWGRLEFHHLSMAEFVGFLYRYNAPVQQAADRPVIDKTGLAGFFDFVLEWTPDRSDGAGLSIYSAIEQQLGLKLQSNKSPMEFLVIDHAEKPAVN